jgi:VIT1/CCC1 family predicted Fe2+/Mn2+ transporter
MNQEATIRLPAEWEGIVNNVERHNARCRFEEKLAKRKLHKQINKALLYAMGAALAILLDFTGLLATWVAVAAAIVLVCLACFTAGRIVGKWNVSYGR